MNNFMPINWTTYIQLTNFLERYKLPNLIQEEIDKLNSLHPFKKLNLYLKVYPQRSHQDPDGFTGEFHLIFEEEIMPILYKLF